MRVLMSEAASSIGRLAAEALADAGHVVHACHEPGMTGFACVALRGRPCPLETHPIDVALAARPYPVSTPLVSEDGVRCAARRHVPLVVAGAIPPNPFAPWTTVEQPGFDVVEAVETAAALPVEVLSTRATEALREIVATMGLAPFAASAEVRRRGSTFRVDVVLTIDEAVSRQALHRIAVLLHRHMRELEPGASGFDFSVVTEQVPA
jgi:hypothetical protein